jgi:hypothetical protein
VVAERQTEVNTWKLNSAGVVQFLNPVCCSTTSLQKVNKWKPLVLNSNLTRKLLVDPHAMFGVAASTKAIIRVLLLNMHHPYSTPYYQDMYVLVQKNKS